MTKKIALITGITGQDGAYLADFLLIKNYIVFGLQQLSATTNNQNIKHLISHDNFNLINGDMTDANNLTSIISKIKPDEIYNLAGQTHVGVSFEMPAYTTNVNALGTLYLLEAIRILGMEKTVKFYQASTSEMFGNSVTSLQNEETILNPASPYAVAKTYAHNMVKVYRDSYGIHASCGILFNHESPIRGEEFVTRKITKAVAAIHNETQEFITLGNINAHRDWGHARDYVRGMHMMLQQNSPDDYVLATGQSKSVREFIETSFNHVDIKIKWQGDGIDEVGLHSKTNKIIIKINSKHYRPNDVEKLIGDASKAKEKLAWEPEINFENLVSEMMESDLKFYE